MRRLVRLDPRPIVESALRPQGEGFVLTHKPRHLSNDRLAFEFREDLVRLRPIPAGG